MKDCTEHMHICTHAHMHTRTHAHVHTSLPLKTQDNGGTIAISQTTHNRHATMLDVYIRMYMNGELNCNTYHIF